MTVPQARSASYPKKLKSLGDHVRAWRVTNRFTQADVAKLLGVCEETIVGWEMRNINPSVKHMPGIIQLIGYLPIEIDTATFGGRISMYRYKYGLTPKKLSHLLSVNASTVRAWEQGKNIPHESRIKNIEETLKFSSSLLSNSSVKIF